MAELSGEKLKLKVRNLLSDNLESRGSLGCVAELAALAVNKNYTGFADARVAAVNLLESLTRRQSTAQNPRGINAHCERQDCETRVVVDMLKDEVKATGKCAIEGFCTKEVWPEDNKPTSETFVELRQKTIEVRGRSLGFICPHVTCGYSCGLSEDVIPGEAGDCFLAEVTTQEETAQD